jgi:phosphoribosylaminoimidazole-succinocarboxamide synthase
MTTLKNTAETDGAAAVFRTNLALGQRREGKVRDIYSLPASPGRPPAVLIIASDRISAFDVVMPTPVPGKGRLLTEISSRWFEFVRGLGLIEDHLISTDPADVPGLSPEEREQLDGRMMLGRAAQVVPIEFVVRGYLAGSGWVEYQQTSSVCGVKLPSGLKQCDKLPRPIFTPATKEATGHDENIDFDRAGSIAGRDVMERLREVSLRIYQAAADRARARGILLADTKFEFGYALDDRGRATDQLLLIDEILTPDSSRFWPADRYQPGRDQDSFDKQYVRNHLLELVKAGRWDKTPPGPALPREVVENTLARYREARDRLFG